MRFAPLYIVGVLALLGIAGCAERDPLDQADELISRKRYSHAIVVYDRILVENPDSVAALIGRGRAHAASDKQDLAIEDFSSALLIDPKRSEAFYRRALVYESLGDDAAAQADRASAHSVDPNYRQAFAGPGRATLASSTLEEEEEEEFELLARHGERNRSPLTAEVNEPGDDTVASEGYPLVNTPFQSAWLEEESRIPFRRTERKTSPIPGVAPGAMLTLDGGQHSINPEAPTRLPFWLWPEAAPTVIQSAIKTPAATSPAVSRPIPVANPYVRAPASAPSQGGAASPAPHGQGTMRPTGSPFPQAPLPTTGR